MQFFGTILTELLGSSRDCTPLGLDNQLPKLFFWMLGHVWTHWLVPSAAKLPEVGPPGAPAGARFRSVGETVLTLSECLLGGLEWGPELVDVLLFKDERRKKNDADIWRYRN